MPDIRRLDLRAFAQQVAPAFAAHQPAAETLLKTQ
jgi:hypothetical protein